MGGIQGPDFSSVMFRRGSPPARTEPNGVLPSVGVLKPGSRRVALYLWFLETRPRSRATTSNVLKLADKV